jgi:anti-sigma factor RsiW
MMFSGDQHVDDWAEVAVDYLDGQLGQQTRLAVEAHLAGCPECAARLRKQQYVVKFLQETILDDPPEDLEYHSIGELVFPSPGGQPLAPPVAAKKPAVKPHRYRLLRPWIPSAIAVVALIAAVVGYNIARSNSNTNVALDSARVATTVTAVAGAATTEAASEATMAGALAPTTTAGAATTTTALASAAPSTDAQVPTFAATSDPKAMVQALQTAQAPTYVSFQTSVAAPAAGNLTDDTGSTYTTAAGATSTTVASPPTTAVATPDTTVPSGEVTAGTVSTGQAAALLDQIKQFTGLEPVDKSLWLGGPTFAVFLPRNDAAKLVDLIRSMSSSFGLTVSIDAAPPANTQEACAKLLGLKSTFPVLLSHRAGQPSTWGFDFTTSTLGPTGDGTSGSTKALPDEDGSHVVVVILIAE